MLQHVRYVGKQDTARETKGYIAQIERDVDDSEILVGAPLPNAQMKTIT